MPTSQAPLSAPTAAGYSEPRVAVAAATRFWIAERDNSFRRVALGFVLAFVFVRFSMLHEYATIKLGSNAYILYLLAPPAVLGMLMSGGIRRSFRGRVAYFWLAFAAWMAAATPFSNWRGGSLMLDYRYLKTELIMFFLIAGLVLTWGECKAAMYTIAAAGFVNIAIVRSELTELSSRLAMEKGTIGNSNDLAMHLLLIVPFLLYAASRKHWLVVFRALFAVAACLAVYLILGTASRGALAAIIVCCLFVAVTGSNRQRLVLLGLIPLGMLIFLLALPDNIRHRLSTYSASEDAHVEAIQSQQGRMYVFELSLLYTLQNPIFGLGPGQFANYEGMHNQIIGDHGLWRETHSLYTQVSSECGIPALLFYLGALVLTFRMTSKASRDAKARPGCEEIVAALFWLRVSMVGFCTAAMFLSLAYTYYLPALSGLAVALCSAAERKMAGSREGR